MTDIINLFDSMTVEDSDLPLYLRDYLCEKELFYVLDIPNDLNDCHQVAQVVIPNLVLEIYYNDVLQSPLVRFQNDWIYFGDSNTTFRQLLTYFGITDPIITWIEPLYDINEVYLDDVVSISPVMILEMGEDYDGRYGEDVD